MGVNKPHMDYDINRIRLAPQPYTESNLQYVDYDLDRIQWKNQMVAKYMIQSEEIHEIIKGLVQRRVGAS